MKKIVIVCCMFLLFAIIGCGKKQEQPKSYTYSDLLEEQQVVVDKVLEQYDMWKTASAGTEWRECTNVAFFKENNLMIFATCYKDNLTPDIAQVYKICKVDTETGKLSGHSYTVYDSTQKMVAMVQASSGHEFSDSLSEEEKKNALADEYYKALNE